MVTWLLVDQLMVTEIVTLSGLVAYFLVMNEMLLQGLSYRNEVLIMNEFLYGLGQTKRWPNEVVAPEQGSKGLISGRRKMMLTEGLTKVTHFLQCRRHAYQISRRLRLRYLEAHNL